jgi:hypothetical protein
MEISTILSAMLMAALGDCLWWLVTDLRLRGTRRAWLWRTLIALFVGSMLAYTLIGMVEPVSIRRSRGPVPLTFQVVAYIWHILILPVLGLIGGVRSVRAWRRRVRPGARPDPLGATARDVVFPRHKSGSSDASPALDPARSARWGVSRRQVLAAAAVAAPPLIAVSVGAAAIATIDELRIRKFELRLLQLPPAFDGMTIAQVSDTHIGKFFHAGRLPGLARVVNDMNADFIVFTGDLIDADLDDLPAGIEFLHRLKPRTGQMAICEGNHDLIQDRGAFERQMLDAGLPMLVGAQRTLAFRGAALQFLGVPWNTKDPLMADSVQAIRPLIDPHAFPILLAHHPHAFDAAADAGLPLVLSGHTHGGQLMLTPHIGAGNLRFRYISGLYRKNNSSLLVSNGIGNWFPLRVNAPAELLHITLRSQ